MALDDLTQARRDAEGAGLIVGCARARWHHAGARMKAVDRVVGDLFKQKEALEIGQGQILRTGPEAMTPQGLQRLEAAGGHAGGPISPGQADMLKAGTRADIERMVGTNANDVAGAAQGGRRRR
jgi:hypothetical protein